MKNEFDHIYTGQGASGMNAFTTEDMTGYFINVPANKLELWMWMESERICCIRCFANFMPNAMWCLKSAGCARNRLRWANSRKSLIRCSGNRSPYSWPVVGWPSDIPAISKAQADEFYATYYAPQNITLILVGDFKASRRRSARREIFRTAFRAGPKERRTW